MSLYLRRKIIISIFLLVICTSSPVFAKVYVYEVTTATTRFQTASKMPPDAFFFYNGGFDVIHNLKVLATYADKDMAKALKDYNLEKNNNNPLLHDPIPRNVPKRPYYWWR